MLRAVVVRQARCVYWNTSVLNEHIAKWTRSERGVDFLCPTSLAEALEMKSQRPDAVPLAGGTDLMVELNFDQRRPEALLDLTRVGELTGWTPAGDEIVVGAGLPYTRLITELGGRLPALAMAARTIGSPQIRNRGTVGGNLGSASPAGDTHPVLLVDGAQVEVASIRGGRLVPAEEFYLGPKRAAMEPDELITAIRVPEPTGPEQFSKVGTRNAMVIAVCSFAIALRPETGKVSAAVGSAGPVPTRIPAAEDFLAGELAAGGLFDSRAALSDALCRGFGELVGAGCTPIDDVRGRADYRRHALAVLARRALNWAWNDYREEGERACA